MLKCSPFITLQWRSQNAEKDTHTKGRLLDQAAIFINCVPFQNGKRICSQSERIPSLMSSSYSMENYFYHIR